MTIILQNCYKIVTKGEEFYTLFSAVLSFWFLLVVYVKGSPRERGLSRSNNPPGLARFLHEQKNASHRKNIFLAENQTGAQRLSEAL